MQIHEIKGFISHLYLVEYSDRLLLLDAGCRGDIEVVKCYLADNLKRSLHDIELVVVTHAHPDHSGGAIDYIKNGIPVAAPSGCNHWYKGLGGLATYATDIALTHYVAKRLGRPRPFRNIRFPRQIPISKNLCDGDLVPGFSDWRVFSTPGHTDCDISVFHQEAGVAYVADNLIALKNRVIRPYPLCHPEAYKRSLQKYIDLGVNDFLLAHYGRSKVSARQIQQLIQSTPEKPRNHRRALTKALLRRIYNTRRSK